MSGIKIIGMGKALPQNIFTNEDLAKIVDTSDEWITSRTGIRQRYIMQGTESLTELAAEAAAAALDNAGARKEQVGLIVAATCTSEYHLPSLACAVQQKLEIHTGIPAFDINAACSGFVYGLEIVHAMCDLWGKEPDSVALLIGAEQFTKMLDFQDRSTCVLFGDGAACAVIRREENVRFFSHTGADGCPDLLYAKSLGFNQMRVSDQPNDTIQITDREAAENMRESALSMDGSAVFKFAVSAINDEISVLEKKSGIAAADVDYIVCHQANARIINHVRKKRQMDTQKFFVNLQNYGNTSAASIPLALCEMWERGLLKKGTRVFCVGFGAGLTWGGAFLEF